MRHQLTLAETPRCPPFPEIIQWLKQQSWEIQPTPDLSGIGAVNLEACIMHVPLGPSVQDHNTRTHEGLHVCLTKGLPGKMAAAAGVAEESYQAVEDARINGIGVRVYAIDFSAGFVPRGRTARAVKAAIQRKMWRHLCLMLIASTSTGHEAEILEALSKSRSVPIQRIESLAKEAVGRLFTHPFPPQDRTAEIARWLEERFRELRWMPPESQGGTARDEEDVRSSADALPSIRELGLLFPRRAGASRWSLESGPTGDPGSFAGLLYELVDLDEERECRSVQAGRLVVDEPALARRLQPSRMLQRWRLMEYGPVARFPHRLWIDGRVNVTPRPVRAGTILIDKSGSMRLSLDQVDRFVQAVPGAVVAIYAGKGSSGILRVLARDGRAIERGDFTRGLGEMNVVDLPAIRDWLCDRRNPRPWILVSDGHYTGINDDSDDALRGAIREVIERNRVHQVETVDQALALLRNLTAKPGRQAC
jgi:hypothetical protein